MIVLPAAGIDGQRLNSQLDHRHRDWLAPVLDLEELTAQARASPVDAPLSFSFSVFLLFLGLVKGTRGFQ